MDLSKIEANIVLPKNSADKETDIIENLHVSGAWGGSTVRIRWSEIIADPVMCIKKDARIAFRTNATAEQIEFITETPIGDLKKILSDGKKSDSSRGNVGKDVSGDGKEKK